MSERATKWRGSLRQMGQLFRRDLLTARTYRVAFLFDAVNASLRRRFFLFPFSIRCERQLKSSLPAGTSLFCLCLDRPGVFRLPHRRPERFRRQHR